MTSSSASSKPRPALTPGEIRAYPVLPLRDIVVFPHMIVPLFVGREKSVRALEDVMKDDKQILLVTQKNAAQDDPATADIFTVGTVGTVLQLLKLPDGTVKVLVEGRHRARIRRFADHVECELMRIRRKAASVARSRDVRCILIVQRILVGKALVARNASRVRSPAPSGMRPRSGPRSSRLVRAARSGSFGHEPITTPSVRR